MEHFQLNSEHHTDVLSSHLYHHSVPSPNDVYKRIEFPEINSSDSIADLEAKFSVKDITYYESALKCCNAGCCQRGQSIDTEILQARCCDHSVGCECEKPFGFIPKCSLCENPAAAIHLKWCVDKACDMTQYLCENSLDILFDLTRTNVFVCNEHAQECCSEFKHLPTWIENAIETIDRLEFMGEDISYATDRRYSDFDDIIEAHTLKANLVKEKYNKLLETSDFTQKTRLCNEIEFLIGAFHSRVKQFAEQEDYDISDSFVVSCSDSYLRRVTEFISSYDEQLQSMRSMKNATIEAYNFNNEILPKILIPMREVLLSSESPLMLKLCIVAWIVSNYGLFGSYLLNRIPDSIPSIVLLGQSL